jgi:hypothetical protein
MSCPGDDLAHQFRRYSMRKGLFAVLLSTAVLCVTRIPSGGAALAEDPKPDLSGRWTLNDGLSDNPFDKMREAGDGGGRTRGGGGGMPGGGFGRGGGGYGGRGGGGGGRGGGGEGGSGGGSGTTPNEMLEDTRNFVILQKDPELRITTGGKPERVYFLDGRKVEEERSEGTVKTRTKRKGETVVVDTEYPSGREVVQTYEIIKDVKRLVVTTKISGGRRGSFSFRRVYDPAVEPAPATSEPK